MSWNFSNLIFSFFPQLVAGSGATEEVEEKDAGAGGVAEIDVAKADGYTEESPDQSRVSSSSPIAVLRT